MKRICFNLLVLICFGIAAALPAGWSTLSAEPGASLAASLRSGHPRIWFSGPEDWLGSERGTFAWRVLHGQDEPWPWIESPANDQSKLEFSYVTGADEDGDYGADNLFNRYDHDFSLRALEEIIAGKAQKFNWRSQFRGEYNLDHSADEYLADARAKLLYLLQFDPDYEFPYVAALTGSAAYDWLCDETFSGGGAVLSEADKNQIRQRLILFADLLKSRADGSASPFDASEVDNFYYVMMGLALYEPDRVNDPAYAAVNAKAKSYLDAFERDFAGKVLPFWDAQGADGGWHGGLNATQIPFWNGGAYESSDNTAPLSMAPVLYAIYTATGGAIEASLFSTGILKYMPEFQLHMILPVELDAGRSAVYYDIYAPGDEWSRSLWVMPMRAWSRRRFSSDPEQLRLAELGGWIRTHFGKPFTDYGSWDMTEQLLWEDKWPDPRAPEQIGFPLVRHFRNLGWVFIRGGFSSPEDLAALFISQKYHWSKINPSAQNALVLHYRGDLLEGYETPLLVDKTGPRAITTFPVINASAASYAPGSIWDVGPGISRCEDTPAWLHIAADAAHAWPAAKLTSFVRQIVFLKPDRFIINDYIKTPAAGAALTWRLKPAGTLQRSGSGMLTLKNNGGGALWLRRLEPAAGFDEKIGAGSYELTCTSQAAGTRFVHILQIGDGSTNTSSPMFFLDDAVLGMEGETLRVSMPDVEVAFAPEQQISVHWSDTLAPPQQEPVAAAPHQFELLQNCPNPFNPTTRIALKMNDQAQIEVEIFSLSGALQKVLYSGVESPGMHYYHWNGRTSMDSPCPAGVYFCRVRSDLSVQGNKMVLLH